MYMVDEGFESFYNDEGFGPIVDTRPVPSHKLDHYRGKLPDRLLQYWRAYGFAGYGNGLFWMTDPDDYSEVLNAWLYGTNFHRKDKYYVIGRTAFGKLVVWGTKSGPSLTIVANMAMIFPSDKSDRIKDGYADSMISNWLAATRRSSLDEDDDDDRPLFERALKALGPLAEDEIYGFVPALGMGGPARLDHLKKVKAVEHLIFLAQLGDPKIMLDIVKEAKDRGLWK